ncbi:MAG: AAA family ATPase [Phycisphaerales bacterium]|nr:AAA family ATPase [Phycisphaerales bacterium]
MVELVGAARFDRYFADQARIEVDGPVVRVIASSPSLAGLLDRRFGQALRDVAIEVVGPIAGEPKVEFVADSASFEGAPAPGAARSQAAPARGAAPDAAGTPARPSPARPAAGSTRTYRLEDFVVGDSNRLAYNAAANLVETSQDRPAHAGTAPLLFIHGPCGVGKTHLLQGLAARFRELHPGAVVRITTGEAFMNEFVHSIKQTTGGAAAGAPRRGGAMSAPGVERFRRQYRRCDLLCIDDVHFLASKQATQQELLHTFDEIALSGARIALVCDRHPRQIRQFSPALVSRFMAGMVASIEPPDPAVRERAIRLFAQRRGLILEDAAVRQFVERTRTAPGSPVVGLREIEGLVTRVEAIHRLSPSGDAPRSVGVLTIERALGDSSSLGPADAASDLPGSRFSRPVRIETISAQTCTELGVDSSDLGAPTRHKRVVLARAVITHLARQFTTMSYPEIARAIGRPSHSTVITAHQRLQKQVESDESYGIGPEGETMTIRDLLARLRASISRN